MRWWLLLAWLAGCSAAAPTLSAPLPAAPVTLAVQAQPRPAGLSRSPTPAEQQSIHELMRETEAIRQLRFMEPVVVRIQDRAAMRAYVSGAIEEEDLARTRRRYVALGLLDPALDVRELVESLMEEELVGYYDPKQRLLAVRDDVARSLGRSASEVDLEWRATVVHELVHALQDQHLNLGAAMEQPRTTDADDAFGALVEGDATLAMLGYTAGQVGVPLEAIARNPRHLLESLDVSPDRLTGALRRAPPIVREPLLFRYRAGAVFSASLLRRGGWDAVNAAHRNVPRDTLTVLEPERYRSARGLTSHPRIELSWLASAGYRAVDEDVLGSFELEVALAHAGAAARTVARAWRGDSYVVFEHPGGDAVVWTLTFATPQLARRAEQALAGMADTTGKGRQVLREGAHVLVVSGFASELTEALGARFRKHASTEQ